MYISLYVHVSVYVCPSNLCANVFLSQSSVLVYVFVSVLVYVFVSEFVYVFDSVLVFVFVSV